MRWVAALLALALATACAGPPVLDAPHGGVSVAPEVALALRHRVDGFYLRLAHRRFDTLETYNDFIIALALTSTPVAQTIPVGVSTLIGKIEIQWGPMAAAGVVGALPIVIFALAVQRSPYSSSSAQVHLTHDTWTYTLCGAGGRCSLGGQPTQTRGRLVRREALEVALYTFKFAPQLSSLLVYLPPVPGEPPTTVLYFERSQLAAQLSQPLDKTLTLASPPLPSDSDASEAETIDSLTLPHMYRFAVAKLDGGGTELKLIPS